MGATTSSDAAETTSIVNKYMTSFTGKCSVSSNNTNDISISGNGNYISGANLLNNLKETVGCNSYDPQSATFNNSINSALTDSVAATTQDFSQFLDPSGTSAKTAISQNLVNNISQSEIFNCAVNSNSLNLITVFGDSNVVTHIDETNTDLIALQCAIQGGQSANGVDGVVSSISQSASYTSEGIIQPIVDGIQALFQDGIIALLLFIVICVCVILLYKYSTKKYKYNAAANKTSTTDITDKK